MDNTPQTSDAPPIDLTGQPIGDYRLLRRLGRGGMADVYLAEQISLRRNVALKVLRPELAKDHSYVKRFEREAQAAAALVQANIVQIYEVGHVEGYHFIAQEYIRGRNLRQYLDRHGAVEPVMAVNVLRQSAMALQKAYELGVIHRDIKPENIMLSTRGEVKITDFGLARINNNPSDQALTQIGVTMGTPLYMSPEQVGGQAIDHRSDIYSLGVTAYHMLAGEPPFNADNALAIAVQHVNQPPPSLATIRPDVPLELIRVIELMMAKNPVDRPDNPSQLLKMLRQIKIDVDEDWETIIEKLSVHEPSLVDHVDSYSQSQLAATRQLQQVMRGNVRSWWRSRTFWMVTTAVSLVAMFGGMYYANQTPPSLLLKIDNLDNETIPRRDSISEQYEEARWRETEEQERYYQAVLDYFPAQPYQPNNNTIELYRRRTLARLAELYLMRENWAKAKPIFEQFTGYDEMYESYRVTGHAGLAFIYLNQPAASFAGGAEERRRQIREAAREVISQEELLNDYMRKRFLEVTEWLDRPDEPASGTTPAVYLGRF